MLSFSSQVDMHLDVTADAMAKTIIWTTKRRNALMKSVTGKFDVMSLDHNVFNRLDGTLPTAIATDDLAKMISTALSDTTKTHSLVLLKQEVHPLLSPPPGFRSMLRRHLASHFENIMGDLQIGAAKLTASA
jgi:hypothetical protein